MPRGLIDLSRLRLLNGVALLAMAGAELVYGVTSFRYKDLINAEMTGELSEAAMAAGWQAYSAFEGTVLNIYMIVGLLCYILGAVWIYGAVRNAALLDPGKVRIGPGAAIVWHAIPVANLFMPYRAMVQTFNSSCIPPRSLTAATPRLLPVWWGFYLLTGALATAAAIIFVGERSIETYRLAAMIDIANAPLSVVAIWLWWRVINEITDMQRAARPAAPNNSVQEAIQ